MAYSRKFLTVGAMGVAAFALIGAGATASFNDSTSSNQRITAGTASVVVYAAGTNCPTAAYNCKSLTLPAVGPVGSTFLTTNPTVWMKNTGNVPVAYAAIKMTESHNGNDAASNALLAQMNVCIKSTNPNGAWSGVEGNGPLTTALALTPSVGQNPEALAVGQSAPYSVDFYAGKDSNCGIVISGGQGTTNLWAGISGAYKTPASLTDAAQGGVVTPTLTFSVKG